MVRILTWDDVTTREEYTEWLNNITDEKAQEYGFPSADVMRLEHKIGEIAGAWRETKDDAFITEYRNTLYEMLLKGYDINTLPVQSQLPEDRMPELPPFKVLAAIVAAYAQLEAEPAP